MKWIGQHIWSLISRFRSDVYLESLATTTDSNVLVVDASGKVSKNTSGLLTIGTSGSTALAGNTALLAIGTSSSTALAGDTSLLSLGTTNSTALAGNTATITSGQAAAIVANTQGTLVKILPSDFIADDGGRPLAIDDSGSDRWLESHGTHTMFASVEIPLGFKATHVHIYGTVASAMTVYRADINARAIVGLGTGNIGTNLAITNTTANSTNYVLIQLVQTSGEQVNGGIMTIAPV